MFGPIYVSCLFLCAFLEEYRTHTNSDGSSLKVEVEPTRGDLNSFFTLSPVVSGWQELKWLLFLLSTFLNFPVFLHFGCIHFITRKKGYLKKDVLKLSFALSRLSMHPPAHWLNELVSLESWCFRKTRLSFCQARRPDPPRDAHSARLVVPVPSSSLGSTCPVQWWWAESAYCRCTDGPWAGETACMWLRARGAEEPHQRGFLMH